MRIGLGLILVSCWAATAAHAAGDAAPYAEGSVWEMTLVRTAAGMNEEYLRSLSAHYRPVMEEARKQGVVLSYHVIATGTSGPDDWDVLLMVEYKNWAAFDGLKERMRPIEEKIVGSKEQQHQLMSRRLDLRRIVGNKRGQELLLR